MRQNNFIDILHFRHACKVFDTNKKISPEDFELILEAGRLSPSSFGLEPTRLMIIRDKNLREKMKPLCWNQEQITTASELVVFKSRVSDLKAPTNYVSTMVSRRMGGDKSTYEAYQQRIRGFLVANDLLGENIINWTARQAYLMASSMMNCAAFLGIDSCPIEGFERTPIEKLFGIDTFKERVVLIVPFGYRLKEQPSKKYRISMDELVEYK
ncbi:nitroreductase family protein [Helicobacter cappadocius]|uniref:Nitroreductase family protein n=1 Tax=Helicobacter cappadocius TaxID=3063998 RepID=A0AA90TCL5_9HELI|nr:MULTISPECIES: nitroreductase family protein [unclassified Helicobacter]MDO7253858.1 nitroreductase family protein [Helicobacter sp. faydin-H75]MDP2539796.1 nitroreductase family protein [Helicobacter sp. faydin-H76]